MIQVSVSYADNFRDPILKTIGVSLQNRYRTMLFYDKQRSPPREKSFILFPVQFCYLHDGLRASFGRESLLLCCLCEYRTHGTRHLHPMFRSKLVSFNLCEAVFLTDYKYTLLVLSFPFMHMPVVTQRRRKISK